MSRRKVDKYALFATCKTSKGLREHFRVGRPAPYNDALHRWANLDSFRILGRKPTITHDRKRFEVEFFEVRATDFTGRGLGSERHAVAIHVPYRACRVTR